jgi:gluconokinase
VSAHGRSKALTPKRDQRGGCLMSAPVLIVVMGVAGCGKSSVAVELASRLALPWIDADQLHGDDAVAKMRAGIALDDADRWPWLERIGGWLADRSASPRGLIVACSALRRVYRDRLRRAAPGLRFVFLDGDPALIRRRLAARTGHYMPVELLDSQLRTLERPGLEEADVLRVDVDADVASIAASALAAWRGTPPLPGTST